MFFVIFFFIALILSSQIVILEAEGADKESVITEFISVSQVFLTFKSSLSKYD